MADAVTKIDTETQNCCVFCATRAPAPAAGEPEDGEVRLPLEEYKRAELSQLRQIINLDFTSVIGRAVEKPVVNMSHPQVTALLCQECYGAVAEAGNCYDLIQELQVRLVGSLELLHDKVFSLKYNEEKTLAWQQLMMRNPQSALFLPFVEKLRDAVGVQAQKACKSFKEVFSQVNLQEGNNDEEDEDVFLVDDSEANSAQNGEFSGEIQPPEFPPLFRDDVMGDDGNNAGAEETIEEFQAPAASSSQSEFQIRRTYASVASRASANTLPGTSSGISVSNLRGRYTPEGNPSNGGSVDSSSGNPNGNGSSVARGENVTEPPTRRVLIAPPPPSFKVPILDVRSCKKSASGGRTEPSNAPENGEGTSGTTRNQEPPKRGKKTGKPSKPYDRPTDNK